MYTTDEKLRFLDCLIDGVEDQRKKEILSEIKSDVAALPATSRQLSIVRDRLREANEQAMLQNESKKQFVLQLLKDSGVYDDIIKEARRAAESAASSECCRLSGINL